MDDLTNAGSQRFVLLRHELPKSASKTSHWDLMLENHGKLLTWQLQQLPSGHFPSEFSTLGIVRLPDHRLHYLGYEGTISGDRGVVSRVDFGVYKLVPPQDESQLCVVSLLGKHYRIELRLALGLFDQNESSFDKGGEVLLFEQLAIIQNTYGVVGC
jgi:hypothetical protein